MNRIILGFFLLFGCFLRSESQNLNEQIYRSYISGNMDSWEGILKGTDASRWSSEARYELAMAHYGFIGYCLSREEKTRARPYLDRVEALAAGLLESNPDDPRFIALRGALYGFRIFYQPQKAMFIGPKALKTVNLAVDKGPDCPQARVESGNKDWWMPEMFGGSKTRALQEYQRAIEILEKKPESVRDNWYYLNLHMILASWYMERGHSFAARELYRKVIGIEPRFTWAQEQLAK